ncbi:hypothetical protein B0H17DRAFT_1093292 [Mycena rosella]|uniref:F-box domain-containing protein n=1 Tax=Mycena rosella TaxID=1033263 RepID=A0AAD7CUC4_MYCRO|nr:hypothetical protein B0H17DRAFT_1093292 [Mycena rosella]
MSPLYDDLLLRILELVDIRTVLAAGKVGCMGALRSLSLTHSSFQANHHFRAITHTTHLWRSLIRTLHYRSLIELPPTDLFLSYSTPELIQEVKRNAFGPHQWAERSARPPTASRTIHFPIQLENKHAHPGFLDLSDLRIRLLVDGRHLLVSHTNHLELWDIETGLRTAMLVSGFVYGTQHDAAQATVSIVLARAVTHRLLAEMEIIRIDTRTGACTPLYSVLLPTLAATIVHPLICDQFIAVVFGEFHEILLIDWHDAGYLVVPYVSPGNQPPVLVPGFLCVCNHTADGPQLLIYSISSFEGHWRPLSTIDINVPLTRIPSIAVPPIVRQTIECDTVHLAVHPSLLDADAFIVSIYTSDNAARRTLLSLWPPRAAFLRYRLKAGLPPQWRLLSSARAAPHFTLRSLSYSGYAIGGVRGGMLAQVPHHILRMGTCNQPKIPVRYRANEALTPYGGTVISFTVSWVEIAYHQ